MRRRGFGEGRAGLNVNCSFPTRSYRSCPDLVFHIRQYCVGLLSYHIVKTYIYIYICMYVYIYIYIHNLVMAFVS